MLRGRKARIMQRYERKTLLRLPTLIIPFPQVKDLEWQGVGTYDDTVLNQIDQLMVRHSRLFHLTSSETPARRSMHMQEVRN